MLHSHRQPLHRPTQHLQTTVNAQVYANWTAMGHGKGTAMGHDHGTAMGHGHGTIMSVT